MPRCLRLKFAFDIASFCLANHLCSPSDLHFALLIEHDNFLSVKSSVSWGGPVLCCVSLRDVGVAFHSVAQYFEHTNSFHPASCDAGRRNAGPVKSVKLWKNAKRPTAPGHGKLFVIAHVYVCFWLTNERLYRKIF